jgi:hypothetical protein
MRLILMKQSGCPVSVSDFVREDRSLRAVGCYVCVSILTKSSSLASNIKVTFWSPLLISKVSDQSYMTILILGLGRLCASLGF